MKTPRHQATLELRRKGYRKIGEEWSPRGYNLLVYRRRTWGPGKVTEDTIKRVHSDGSMSTQIVAHPEMK
jgi:hypothetical protein